MKTKSYFLALAFALAKLSAQAGDDVSAFKAGNVILFQGHEITGDSRTPGGDNNHNFGQDYAYLIAAKYTKYYPNLQLNFTNFGVSGNTISNLTSRWQTNTIALKPDILSILIGANDTEPVAAYQQAYDNLLATTVAALPNVRLVLCEPFTWPTNVGPTQIARSQALESLALKYNAPVVHFQSAFSNACQLAPAQYWIRDGIHPTPAGHKIMMDEWVSTVQSFYK